MCDFEQQFLLNGFSAKHIRKLNKILTRDEKKSYTLQYLIQEISECFWAGIISMLNILFVVNYGIAKGHKESLISYAIFLIIGAIIVYFIILMNLAWKAHLIVK
ncbi:hypothetical protein WKH63_18455 [Pantoea agglomerans]|uniref:hypothetical protein n=1 Tax=Enterobacter agglomerans TaxID=549 RepID=UPI003C7E1ECC